MRFKSVLPGILVAILQLAIAIENIATENCSECPIPANIAITIDAGAATNAASANNGSTTPPPSPPPTSSQEVLFDLHSNHSLLCTANEPIRWLFRTADNIQLQNLTVPGKSHAQQLQLTDTKHSNAGYYHCVRAEKLMDIEDADDLHFGTFTEMVKRRDASRLYLHVNEQGNLLVPSSDERELFAFQYENLIVPCRRTIPTAQLALKALSRQLPLGTANATASSASLAPLYVDVASSAERWQHKSFPPDNVYASIEYDRTLGFIIRRAERLSEQFVCTARAATTYSNITYNVHLLGFSYKNNNDAVDHYLVDDFAHKPIEIRVDYVGALWAGANVSWVQRRGGLITPGSLLQRRRIVHNETYTALTILNAQLEDTDEYELLVTFQLATKRLRFTVTINAAPVVYVQDQVVAEGVQARLTCRTVAHPKASVTWLYRACVDPPCTAQFGRFDHHVTARPGNTSFEYLHDILFRPPATGVVRCEALNTVGNRSAEARVFVSSDSEDFYVEVSMPAKGWQDAIVVGDEVRLTCAARYYKYANALAWYKNGTLVRGDAGIEVDDTSTEHIFRRTLTFKRVQLHDRGQYKCRARRRVDMAPVIGAAGTAASLVYDMKTLQLSVHALNTPRINASNLHPDFPIERKLGEALELECRPAAVSHAKVTWYHNDNKLYANENINFANAANKLIIPFLRPGDEGSYKCVVANALGSIEAAATVQILDLPEPLRLGWLFGVIGFCITLILLVIYLTFSVRRERKLANELKAAGLALFEDGDIINIDPALTLGEQADLLPYDRRFEFPREKLTLGGQLGAGTFGVVYAAIAEGIQSDEPETRVAVKMVKRGADNETLRALVSELKIMIYIGRHLNVVNLLGAVTKNIAKRELMVIVEHCSFGNLKDYLVKKREQFVDQINPETDKIDASITGVQSSALAGIVNAGYDAWPSVDQLNVGPTPTVQNPNYIAPSDLKFGGGAATPQQQQAQQNDLITTSHLISWAFQVARGMNYLSGKRVVHGDLAARNLLLCENNLVKICDFGLAHSLYKEEYYKKRGDGLLPIKWLSLETLSDNIFNTQTDIWSFGIVLWEFFSCARVPYPGMDPNTHLYKKLRSGYRMEKPSFANDELYDVMLECWSEDPKERPSFIELEQRFARILGEEVTNHYMSLNDNENYAHPNSIYYSNGIKESDLIEYAVLAAQENGKRSVQLEDGVPLEEFKTKM